MGRRPVIFVAAIFSLIPVIGAAVSQTWVHLLICRILLGIGMGCKAAVGKYVLLLINESYQIIDRDDSAYIRRRDSTDEHSRHVR